MSILEDALGAAVPLLIAEYKLRGGPTESDLDWCREFATTLGEKGDILQFRGAKRGESAAVFNGVARALAILAFQPGGVKFQNSRFNSE